MKLFLLVLQLMLIILIGLISNHSSITSVNAEIQIESASAYTNGGSYIKILGISLTSIEKVRINFDLQEYLFSYVSTSSDGSLLFRSPAAPKGAFSSSGQKRSADGSLTKKPITFEIVSQGAVVFSKPFTYIEPTIREIKHNIAFINGKTVTGPLIINGNSFRINPTDYDPTVTIGGVVVPISVLTDSIIEVNDIPALGRVENVAVVVTVYNGQSVASNEQFSFVEPTIHSVSKNGIALKAQAITIFGENFLVAKVDTEEGVTVNLVDSVGQMVSCSNAKVLTTAYDSIECIVPIINGIDAGHEKDFQIVVSFQYDSSSIQSKGTVFYKSYVPIISRVTPSSGLKDKGTLIKVDGVHLESALSIKIGGVECDIDPISLPDVYCTTGPYTTAFPAGEYEQEFNLIAQIDGVNIQSLDQVKFKYFEINFDRIEPPFMVSRGITPVRLFGQNLDKLTKLKVGQQELSRDQLNQNGLSNDQLLIINLDSSLQVSSNPGDSLIISGEVDGQSLSQTLPLLFNEPKIIHMDKIFGLLNNPLLTTIIQVENSLPPPNVGSDTVLDDQLLAKYYQFRVGGHECQQISLVTPDDYSKFKCKLPDTQHRLVGSYIVEFILFGQSYSQPTTTFTYYEVTINQIIQTSKSPVGGDIFTITGTNFNHVQGVVVDEISLASCNYQPNSIQCTRPPLSAGTYPVTLELEDNQVLLSTDELEYDGPFVKSIAPRQYPKKKDVEVIIVGGKFGNDVNNIQVKIGSHDCINIGYDPASPEDIYCLRVGADDEEGDLPVRVTVTDPVTNIALTSGDPVVFTAQILSCLGQYEEDGSNPYRDWFFVLKMNGASEFQKYLWLDNTIKELQVDYHLGPSKPNSPRPFNMLEATYDQLFDDYNYILYSEQRGKRDSNGAISWRDDVSNGGHSKGIYIWEDLPNGGVRGIHIHHSNPIFPTKYSANKPQKFASPHNGKFWIGTPRLNQHFFCYPVNDLNVIGEYLFKNDVHLMDLSKYPDIPNEVANPAGSWNQARIDANPYFYDYLQSYGKWARRQDGNGQNVPNRQDLVDACRSAIVRDRDLKDQCYWISPQFLLSGMKANYFYRTSLTSDTTRDFSLDPAHANGLSDYLTINQGSTIYADFYDGIDLWSIVGDYYQKKMFAYYYLTGSQLPVNEFVVDVSTMRFPPYISKLPNGKLKFHVHQGGTHAKMAFPVFPQMDPNHKHDDGENMVCFGDVNRHNHQGSRGGGAICIQHPELAYQLNRMVHIYSTKQVGSTGLGEPHGRKNGVFYMNWVLQPVQMNRITWDFGITVEVKEVLVAGSSTRRIPRQFETGFDDAAKPHDVPVGGIRTTLDRTVIGDEESLVDTNSAFADKRDIKNFVAHDIMALDFVASTENIAICDYTPNIFGPDGSTCIGEVNARTTPIQETTGFHQPPQFPVIPANTAAKKRVSAYKYLSRQSNTRTFDVNSVVDYQSIEYLEKLLAHIKPLVSGGIDLSESFFHYLIKPDITKPYLKANTFSMMRNTDAYCPEELTYLTLLRIAYKYNYVKNQEDDVFIFTVNEDQPNFANGILLAISKYLYNELDGKVGQTNFDACFDYFDKFKTGTNTYDLFAYKENAPIEMNNPTVEQLFYRSAAATWDWLNSKYADENGLSVDKQAGDVSVDWVELYSAISIIRSDQGVNNMLDLLALLAPTYSTETNKNILFNRYIIPRPPQPTTVTTLHATTLFARSPEEEEAIMSTWLEEDLVTPALVQLFNDPTDFIKQSDILNESQANIAKLIEALDEWQTIGGVNQAIRILLREPKSQTGNQAIKFLEEINRDHVSSHPINLCYRDGTLNDQAQGSIQICSPMSIYTITKLLKQVMVSNQDSWDVLEMGDLVMYYLAKPSWYNNTGYIKNYEGLIFSTLNSKLCDIQMANYSQFDNYETLDTCTRFAGPVISYVNPPSGVSGTTLTIMGMGFNSSQTVEVGGEAALSFQLLDPSTGSIDIPDLVVGTKNLVKIRGYNLQRTTFEFNLYRPVIDSVSNPSNTLNSNGGEIITISGNNFGWILSQVEVLFDNAHQCTPQSVTPTVIMCITPPGFSKYTIVSVRVANQQTQSSLTSPIIFYEQPRIDDVVPTQVDPRDFIVIHGDAFGPHPLVGLDNSLLDVVNSTNNYVMAQIPIGKTAPNNPMVVVISGGVPTSATGQLKYIAPVITKVVSRPINTSTGGVVAFEGYGWGNSRLDIDFVSIQQKQYNTTVNPVMLQNCRPFETLVECYVPRGVGGNMVINASVNGQVLIPSTVTFSYAPPTIYQSLFNGDGIIVIKGENLVPPNLDSSPNPSFAAIIHFNNNQPKIDCYLNYFFNETTTQCAGVHYIDLSMIKAIQVMIGGQLSNNITLGIQINGFIWKELDYDGVYDPPPNNDPTSELPFTAGLISLTHVSSGLTIPAYFDPYNLGHFSFRVSQPGSYYIKVVPDDKINMLVQNNSQVFNILPSQTVVQRNIVIFIGR